jgi:hypothetical protein
LKEHFQTEGEGENDGGAVDAPNFGGLSLEVVVGDVAHAPVGVVQQPLGFAGESFGNVRGGGLAGYFLYRPVQAVDVEASRSAKSWVKKMTARVLGRSVSGKGLRRAAICVGQKHEKGGAGAELGVHLNAAAGVLDHALDHVEADARAVDVVVEALEHAE